MNQEKLSLKIQVSRYLEKVYLFCDDILNQLIEKNIFAAPGLSPFNFSVLFSLHTRYFPYLLTDLLSFRFCFPR